MTIEIEAYVDKTEDGGFEFKDRVGAVIIHVDGNVVKANPAALIFKKIADSDDYHGPLYAVSIAKDTLVSIQKWSIETVQTGSIAELLKEDVDD